MNNLLHFTQLKSKYFKNIEKIQGKAIRILNFLPLNAPFEKQKYEMNILKLKVFIMLRNILFVKDCLNENAPGGFNDKFHSSKLRMNHTARSSSTYQLKVINFMSFTLVLQITVMKYTPIRLFIHSFIQ